MPSWSMLSFQDSASPMMEELSYFHDFTMVVIIAITVLVGFNMSMMMYYKMSDRYLLQNQMIEMIWTVLPVFVLFGVAAPSLKVLYMVEDPFTPNLTVKAVGHQWYWSYEYSDFPEIEFSSYMTPVDTNSSQDSRLLEADNSLVLPVSTQIRVIITASDVLHSWAVPAMGVKADAVPGRLNQIMFSAKRTGIFYGQCSEICGANHSFMPIKLEIVPMTFFSKWIKSL